MDGTMMIILACFFYIGYAFGEKEGKKKAKYQKHRTWPNRFNQPRQHRTLL